MDTGVWRCIDVTNGQELVCKVLGREAAQLLAAHDRVLGLPGAAIAPPKKVLVTAQPGAVYMLSDRSYGDLHSYVRSRRRLRESEARRLFRTMVHTVRACHREGVVLRDLKLRKFVFEDPQRSQVRLESLEDAVLLDNPEDDRLQDKRGCPAYVSPEILRTHAQYSGRAADMWSLGVILYTMLCGRYPFSDPEHTSSSPRSLEGLL